jgi:hypothetical protein
MSDPAFPPWPARSRPATRAPGDPEPWLAEPERRLPAVRLSVCMSGSLSFHVIVLGVLVWIASIPPGLNSLEVFPVPGSASSISESASAGPARPAPAAPPLSGPPSRSETPRPAAPPRAEAPKPAAPSRTEAPTLAAPSRTDAPAADTQSPELRAPVATPDAPKTTAATPAAPPVPVPLPPVPSPDSRAGPHPPSHDMVSARSRPESGPPPFPRSRKVGPRWAPHRTAPRFPRLQRSHGRRRRSRPFLFPSRP